MDMLIARDVSVTASFDGGIVPVIQELSFSLPAGRILGLVGESGAGKSMIGRTIAQLLPPGFSVARGDLMCDGLGWKPLSHDFDYAATDQRVVKEIFPGAKWLRVP